MERETNTNKENPHRIRMVFGVKVPAGIIIGFYFGSEISPSGPQGPHKRPGGGDPTNYVLEGVPTNYVPEGGGQKLIVGGIKM